MDSIVLFICVAAFVVGVAFYSYKHRQVQKQVSKEDEINRCAANMTAEEVDNLSLPDVLSYFKSLNLNKGVNIPFIATPIKNGEKHYLIASYNEKTNELEHVKLINAKSVSQDLLQILGEEKFVVLS